MAVTVGDVQRARSGYVLVIVDGRLAFKYDPKRHLVEWQHRGEKHVIDLALIDDQAAQGDGNGAVTSSE